MADPVEQGAQTLAAGARPRTDDVHDVPPFYEEEDLRDWRAANPGVLPSVQAGPAAAAREVGMPHMAGRIDLLVVDLNGAITVVECKLAKNPEQHAAVVGQLLSYAAGLSNLRYEDIRAKFEPRAGSLAAASHGDARWDDEAFRCDVSQNLADGRMHLVIAADEASDALRRTVEFVGMRMPGVDLQLREFGNALGPLPKRPEDWIGAIRALDDSAGDAAQALRSWAEDEPQLKFELRRHEGVVRARDTVCRIKRHRYLRVSLDKIALQLGPSGGGRVEQLGRQLKDMGFELRGAKARIPLEGLRVEQFLAVMQPIVESLSNVPTSTQSETGPQQ